LADGVFEEGANPHADDIIARIHRRQIASALDLDTKFAQVRLAIDRLDHRFRVEGASQLIRRFQFAIFDRRSIPAAHRLLIRPERFVHPAAASHHSSAEKSRSNAVGLDQLILDVRKLGFGDEGRLDDQYAGTDRKVEFDQGDVLDRFGNLLGGVSVKCADGLIGNVDVGARIAPFAVAVRIEPRRNRRRRWWRRRRGDLAENDAGLKENERREQENNHVERKLNFEFAKLMKNIRR